VNNSGASWSNLTKLGVHVVRREAGRTIYVQIFHGPAPLQFASANFEAILNSIRLYSQISRERQAENGVINHNSSRVA